jgi:hypothetical protein
LVTKDLHPIDPLAPNVRREHRPEPIPPEPHRLVTGIDAALEQQVLNVAQAQRIPSAQHHNEPDHFW